MASRTTRSAQIARLDPKVNRILYVRNLPFKITAEELYEIFGRYGALRQVRVGAEKDNRGTAFVVYEDIFDAKTACEHLSGFNVGTRYLTVLYFQASKVAKVDLGRAQDEVEALRARVAAGEEAAAAAASAAAASGAGAGAGAMDDDEKLGLDAEEKDRSLARGGR